MPKVRTPMFRRIAWLLTFAGAIPFVAATVAIFFFEESHIRVPAIAALITYSAVILSFLGGISWGLALREEAGNDATRCVALGLSTIPSLAAWAVLWLPTTQWQLGTALAIFVLAWAADLWLSSRGLLPAWFVDLRTAITALVAAILGAAIWRI